MNLTERYEGLDPTIENWPALETHFIEIQRNLKVAKFVFGAVGNTFDPDPHFAPGLRTEVSDFIRDADKEPVIVIAPNHVSNLDPFNLAALLYKDPLFRPFILDAAIPSKTELFEKYGPLIRYLIEQVGAYTAFRKSDGGKEPSDEVKLMLSEAMSSTERLNTFKVLHHILFGVYVEGTRNKTDDPTKVQRTGEGLARSIIEVVEQKPVLLLPAGTRYKSGRNATMCLDEAITSFSKDPAEINGQLSEGIQRNVNWAQEFELAA